MPFAPKLSIPSPRNRRVETAAQLKQYAEAQGFNIQQGLRKRGYRIKQQQADGTWVEVFHSLDRKVFFQWVSRALQRDEDDVPLDLV